MKKGLLATFAIILTGALSAQSVKDTVSLGAGYTNQVWYQLENGSETSTPKTSWDISFQAESFEISVGINSTNGVNLWVYPGDTTDWTTLDTTGYSAWTQQYNDVEDWSMGAFAQPQVGLHYGWGGYNTTTHQVIGDKIFLLELNDGSFQKVWIQSLIGGVYTFRHASLDNNMDMVHTIDKSAYSTKAFVYFNLLTHQAVDPEPDMDQWDLLFTQYNDFVPTAYTVSGVLLNPGLQAAEVMPVDTAIVDTNGVNWTGNRNTIGYTWKAYQGAWVVFDSITYYVQDNNDAVWKVIFTGFGGAGNGNFIFTKEKLDYLSAPELHSELGFIDVYPNPVSDILNVAVKSENALEFSIYNLNGQFIRGGNLNNAKGSLTTVTLNMNNLDKGMYLIQFNSNTTSISKKVIVK